MFWVINGQPITLLSDLNHHPCKLMTVTNEVALVLTIKNYPSVERSEFDVK